MATSPAPDAAAPPGMCPGIAVLGGGGGNGDGSGDGDGNGDGSGGDGKGNGDGASGKGKNGGDAEGDPICPITGRMFVAIFDFGSPGPLPLRFLRHYSSRASNRDGDFGFGWSHSFGFRLRVRRRAVELQDDEATLQLFDLPSEEAREVKNGLGWRLSREEQGFRLVQPLDGRTMRFGPAVDGVHHLVSVADRNGNTIRVERDERGRLVALEDSAGRPIRFTTDAKGRVVRAVIATDPEAKGWMELAAYAYDDDGNLVGVTDAEGYAASYAYDGHLMTEHHSVTGLTYYYRYDGRSEDAYCLESWGEYPGRPDPALERPLPPPPASGRDTRKVKGINHVVLTYDKASRYTEVQTSLGGLKRYFGDEMGRVIKEVDLAGGVTERTFDPETGALVGESTVDGEPRVVTANDAGVPIGFTPAGGEGVETFLEAGTGEEITHDHRTGATTRRRHDARGNLVFVEHPDGTHEETEYDHRGLITRYVNRLGAVTRIHHDAMGNCVRVELGDNRVEQSEYDYLGRRIGHMDESGNVTEWAYDRRSEAVWKKLPNGSEIRVTRGPHRKPLTYEHAGRTTRFEWGGMDWLTRMVFPDGTAWELRYDTEGNPTYLRNPRGQDFRLVYTPAGRCVNWTTFEGIAGAQGFDVLGRKIWLATPLGRCAVQNRRDGSIETLETPDQTLSFEFGPSGMTKLDNGMVPLSWKLDPLGRVVEDHQGKDHLELGWLGGELATIVPSRGLAVGYERDNQCAVSAIQVGGVRVETNIHERQDILDRLGDGLVQRRHYNALGALERISLARSSAAVPLSAAATSADPGLLFWASYEYDGEGYLLGERRSDGTTVGYTLTANAQVASRRVGKDDAWIREERLRYDAAGTPLMDGATYDAMARPLSFANVQLEYDVAGRLVKRRSDRGDWTFRWNALDQLVRVDAPDRIVEMDYDGRGRRMRKRVKSRAGALLKSISYVWSNNVVLHELDELGGGTRTYLRQNERWEITGHVDAAGGVETPCFYVLRPNGAIDHAVDAAGNVVWDAEMTVYGACAIRKADVDVTLRFPNQFYDADVELVYNLKRWYDPKVGQYVSSDPLLLGGNINPRDYAANPTRQIDPTGQVSFNTTTNPQPTPTVPGQQCGTGTTPGQSLDGTGASAGAFSQPGGWAVPAGGANGSSVPGYANCPGVPPGSPNQYDPNSTGSTGALDLPRGFGGHNTPGSAQNIVNNAGNTYGCHTCGSRDSGDGRPLGSQHWTCDHQPPRASYSQSAAAQGGSGPRARELSRQPGAVRLYPQCQRCSNAQATAVSAEQRTNPAQGSSRAIQTMHNNLGT